MRKWKCLALALALLAIGLACLHEGRTQTLPLLGAGRGTTTVASGSSVTLDQVGTNVQSSNGVTSFSYDGQTITGGLTNSALVLIVVDCGAAGMSSVTASWDSLGTPQSMTSLGSVSSGAGGVFLFGLRNPTSGNKRTAIAWTGSSQVTVSGISFSGVNQASDAAAFTNFNSATNAAPITSTITSAAGNIVVAGFVSVANFTSVNNTQVFIDNTCSVNAAAANRASGAATVAMTGNPGSAILSAVAGVSVAQ